MADQYGLGLPQHQPMEYEWDQSQGISSGCNCQQHTAYGSSSPQMLNAAPIDATDDGVIPGRTIREVVPMPEVPPEPELAPAAEPRDVNLPPATAALLPVSHWEPLPVETLSVDGHVHRKARSVQRIPSQMHEAFRIEAIEIPAGN